MKTKPDLKINNTANRKVQKNAALPDKEKSYGTLITPKYKAKEKQFGSRKERSSSAKNSAKKAILAHLVKKKTESKDKPYIKVSPNKNREVVKTSKKGVVTTTIKPKHTSVERKFNTAKEKSSTAKAAAIKAKRKKYENTNKYNKQGKLRNPAIVKLIADKKIKVKERRAKAQSIQSSRSVARQEASARKPQKDRIEQIRARLKERKIKRDRNNRVKAVKANRQLRKGSISIKRGRQNVFRFGKKNKGKLALATAVIGTGVGYAKRKQIKKYAEKY